MNPILATSRSRGADPLADPTGPMTLVGVPLVAKRLPSWTVWAVLAGAFLVVGGPTVVIDVAGTRFVVDPTFDARFVDAA